MVARAQATPLNARWLQSFADLQQTEKLQSERLSITCVDAHPIEIDFTLSAASFLISI